MHVIGTAGHVDHGKTLLIKALTGIDTDRLPEEKQRGLTIDLGFAYFAGRDGRTVGVVDVPGHERFIRNMVAGAWCLDCALLVVAADEGWMQQSTDHARVLAYLGVPCVIVVATKSDLVEEQMVDEIRQEAVRRCKAIGGWSSPSIGVSAAAGKNIDKLKELILKQLDQLAGEPKSAPYLYVDRVFSVKGSGKVVTGTLKGGSLFKHTELIAVPPGSKLRMRRLQSYYSEVEKALPVSRVAINVQGEKLQDLRRGVCVTTPGAPVRSEKEFIAQLRPGAASEGRGIADNRSGPKLRNHGEVEIALGSGHQTAVAHFLAGDRLVRVCLAAPLAMIWGQAFLVIQRGGSTIIGGGKIVWLGATSASRRAELAEVLEQQQVPDLLHLRLQLDGMVKCDSAQKETLLAEPGLTAKGSWVFRRERLESAESLILESAEKPGGISFEALKSRVGLEDEPLRLVCEGLYQKNKLRAKAGLFQAGNQAPESSLSPMGKKLLADLKAAGEAGIEPARLKIEGLLKTLRELARLGLAVSLDSNIYYSRQTYERLVRQILDDLELGADFAISYVKERTSLSRKFSIPLLNRMETDGLVKRTGDVRVVASKELRGDR